MSESVPLTGRLRDNVGSDMESDSENELEDDGNEMVREWVGFRLLLKDKRSDTLSVIRDENVKESDSWLVKDMVRSLVRVGAGVIVAVLEGLNVDESLIVWRVEVRERDNSCVAVAESVPIEAERESESDSLADSCSVSESDIEVDGVNRRVKLWELEVV